VTYGAKDCTGQIEAQIADVAELIVDIVAEQVQEEHISADVQKRAVKKCVA
jgi:hypothetical protein